MNEKPHWICFECAKAEGHIPSKESISTYHVGVCDICKKVTSVTDFKIKE